ncbi:MAG: zinc-ribbon domain-containing protein [Leptospiraceae bacterium]|nr:hypothetical protein [Leptospiraceae bacterium]MCK6380597.1 zinc-ribbon domain-containing protein [Leptospiraceae bacterium]NUM42221.1 hypothetical protein [Leptospiraceae bacterium]
MNYIRSCPSCDSELRFPIDKGTLTIKCPRCNHSFTIDPDDPLTYHLGRFEYSLPNSKKNSLKDFKEKVLDILYLPIYLLKNNFQFSKINIKKVIPTLLFVFVFLNIYQICSINTPKKEVHELKSKPDDFPQGEEETPEEKSPEIDDRTKPEYET